MPLARQVVKDLAVEHGACIRPVQLRRTNLDTGDIDQVLVPCGHTLASVCPSCAERARSLRAAQCREGWHLEDEPDLIPDPATEDQQGGSTMRAEAQQLRDQAEAAGQDTTDFDALITELDEEIAKAGIRGKVNPDRPARRHRSTRRRQDAPDLPRRKVTRRTVGKTYTAPDGKTFRPSMFITLTCPSYGRVGDDGVPTDPAAYDYDRAARDALAFAALFDRFIQNLRRYLGYDVQYFAAVEPQKRLAPHIHLAMRGTVSRAELRRVLAATYHQIWWPSTSAVKFDGDELPVWDEVTGAYLDPATGEVLPTWDQALDAIGDQASTRTGPPASAGTWHGSVPTAGRPSPAPAAPATSTWVPCSRTSHGSPASRLPTGRALRSGRSGTGMAGTMRARASRRTNSSTTAPDRAVRTRHSIAPNPCARFSARFATSAADWPETRRTWTRSVYLVAVTLPRTGSRIRP